MLLSKKYQVFLFFNSGKIERRVVVDRRFLLMFGLCALASFLMCYTYFLSKGILQKEVDVYWDNERDFNAAYLELSKYLVEASTRFKKKENIYNMFLYDLHLNKERSKSFGASDDVDMDRLFWRKRAEIPLNEISFKSDLFLKNLDNAISLDKIKDHFGSVVPYGWPLKDHHGVITSTFGARFSPFERVVRYHTGVDLGAPGGTNIVSSGDGRVEFANYRGDLGFAVVIRHNNNYSTRYGHMQQILVKEGQLVKKGDVIGSVGLSGRTTGYHLHFEVRYKNEPVNPMLYIRDSQ